MSGSAIKKIDQSQRLNPSLCFWVMEQNCQLGWWLALKGNPLIL